MAVDTQHATYSNRTQEWCRMRHFLEGEQAVKGAGTVYLPRLTKQDDAQYAAYKARATFFNATARTHQALSGVIFRNDPKVTLPETGMASPAAQTLNLDADMTGKTLYDYARMVTDEVLAVGRGATLVDWSEGENRPFFAFYCAEDIVNWRTERHKGRTLLTLVVLRERRENHGVGGYDIGSPIFNLANPISDDICQSYRVLRLVRDEASGERYYQQELYSQRPKTQADYEAEMAAMPKGKRVKRPAPPVKTDSSTTAPEMVWDKSEPVVPMKKGARLTEIPLVFHGPDSVSFEPQRPPLDDLVVLNLDHYRAAADYRHGMHFTACPTVWIAGVEKGDAPFVIGAEEAWVFADKDTQVGILEYTGQGLGGFEKYLDKLEHLMAVIGARMLEEQRKGIEKVEAMQIRQSGESSALSKIANSVSEQLTTAAKIAMWWAGFDATSAALIPDDEVSIILNTDFSAFRLSGQELTALVSAWQLQAISWETLHYNLQRGEIAEPATTAEEEKTRIQNTPPPSTLDPEPEPKDDDAPAT